jgi:hypothetical protein
MPSSALVPCTPPQGTPTGDCASGFAQGKCSAANVTALVKKACLGKNKCTIAASNSVFGEPCANVRKVLAVRGSGAGCIGIPTNANHTIIYDFGTNMAGFTTLVVPAPLVPKAGASVTLRHAETLHTDGSLATDAYYPGDGGHSGGADPCGMPAWYKGEWSECANQTDMYIFGVGAASAGAGVAYTPSFTYHGFRYVQLVLQGFSNDFKPTIAMVTAHFAHTDLPVAGNLTLSSVPGTVVGTADVLNRVYAATLRAQLSNLWSIPTDCPQREKRGWMCVLLSFSSIFDRSSFFIDVCL